jgi:hypothetical protein
MALLSVWEQNAAGNKIYYGTSYPTASTDGTFEVGDRVINTTTPANGVVTGWRCSVRGAPGTWVKEAALATI